jgi:translation initiation factor 5
MSSYDPKLERAVVNGKHESGDLQKILEKFIELFVLCPNCKLPELKMSVKQQTKIKIHCAACGHNGLLPTSHKLTGYIINNPPPKTARGAHTGKEDEPKDKETADIKAIRAAAEDVEWFTDTSETAQKERKAVEFGAMLGDVAKLQRIDAIIEEARLSNAENAPETVIKVFLANKENATVTEILSELRRVSLARSLDEPQKIKALLSAVIDAKKGKDIHTEFGKHAALFQKIVVSQASAVLFINCIEDFVGLMHPELLPRFPLILKELYEQDVLEEEHILTWFDTPAENSWFVNVDVGNATRAKSVVFVEWLREDEDEDEE